MKSTRFLIISGRLLKSANIAKDSGRRGNPSSKKMMETIQEHNYKEIQFRFIRICMFGKYFHFSPKDRKTKKKIIALKIKTAIPQHL